MGEKKRQENAGFFPGRLERDPHIMIDPFGSPSPDDGPGLISLNALVPSAQEPWLSLASSPGFQG